MLSRLATGLATLLDVELVSLTRREDRIKRALDEVDDRYDVAVLDLAPSLSIVNLAALVAATDIVAPVSASNSFWCACRLSARGFFVRLTVIVLPLDMVRVLVAPR